MASPAPLPERFRIVDSHTGGMLSRVVVDGWPDIPGATMKDRYDYVCEHHDHIRKCVMLEPRGGENYVGVVLTPPTTEGSICGALYPSAKGFLTMCGHATIGTVVTLVHLGRLQAPKAGEPPVAVSIDTAVGVVHAELIDRSTVRIHNVPSFVERVDMSVCVPPTLGAPGDIITGDLCFGGNWNFIVTNWVPELTYSNRQTLLMAAATIRAALKEQGMKDGAGNDINFVCFYGTAKPENHGKNFIAFDGTFDRSPCGTGTSARMAQLFYRKQLVSGAEYRQESITGSVFVCSSKIVTETGEGTGDDLDFKIQQRSQPTIRAQAYIVLDGDLVCPSDDILTCGIE
eukprot:PhM_4_TR11463/c0_g1_i1/m.67391/K12658/lhpA; 4-hydroxyproline epimerase